MCTKPMGMHTHTSSCTTHCNLSAYHFFVIMQEPICTTDCDEGIDVGMGIIDVVELDDVVTESDAVESLSAEVQVAGDSAKQGTPLASATSTHTPPPNADVSAETMSVQSDQELIIL